MQYDLHHKLADKLDKYATRIELLEEELRCTNQALEQKSGVSRCIRTRFRKRDHTITK